MHAFESTIPSKFIYGDPLKQTLRGEALVRFYNEQIPNVEEITDPCRLLQKFFTLQLTESDYLQNLNLGKKQGDTPATLKEATQEKRKKTKAVNSLLQKIETHRRDRVIPHGKEAFYYAHLKRILKHLLMQYFLNNR